jgi:amino acid adenylation domain-containing protein
MSNVSTDLTAEQKRELLAKLLKQKAQPQIVESPLAYGQQALWFLYQMDRTSAAYNVMYAAHVRGDVDRDALQRAFQKVIDRHGALRTTYGTKHGRPTQFVHPRHKLEIQLIDAANWDQDELDYRIQVEADKPFDLEKGPVIRVQLFDRPGQRHVLLFTSHHIALDFWAFDLLFEELEARYREEVSGTPANLRAPKIQFTDYVAWQQKMLAGKDGERLGEYWKKQLDGDLPNLDLPTDRPRPPVQSFNGKSYHFKLADDVAKQLAELAKANGTTLYATVLAAFQVLLYRYSGQQDILVGSPTAGRNRAELEEILGYFLNPIVLRAKMAPEKTFAELLAEVRTTLLDGLTNQDYPFPMVVEDLQPPRDASRSPIFQVAFGWDKPRRLMTDQTAATTANDPGALGLEPFALGQQGSAFDLMMMMISIGDSLSGALQYNTDLFDESTVARMIGHFQVLLAGIIANPNTLLADLPLLSEAEQRHQLYECNQTKADYPREKCLHQLFEDQMAGVPNAIAVVHGDEQLTYAELNARANQLAAYLRKQNVGPDALVGICVDRSIEMLVGILGILKAGGAYVPLAPGTPSDRLAYMLEESHAPVVLTQSELLDELPQHSGKTICLDKDWPSIAEESADNLVPAAEPHNLAYVIFTSGSTGKPKGVQIEHRTVVNFLNSMRREPGITADDNLLAVTTLTFDISVLELFLPISVGARVTIVTREQAADGVQLLKALVDTKATIMQATPATWRILIEAGWQGDGQLKVLCGGEAMPRDLADQLLQRAGSLWNMYGPTETTIWSAVDHVGPGQGGVPIGHPIDNTQIYILDVRMQPVPTGVPGDLYIGGDGLARGYLNRPELTAERFIPNPFVASTSRLPSGTLGGRNHSDISTPSLNVQRQTAATSHPAEGTYLARMYKTGDLARRRADGNIDFLGRQDFQVKVRGFRIELGEIEATLNEHPAIQQSVVTARQMGQHEDDKALVAYFVADTDEPPNVSELREFLREELPDYMIPSIFMAMDKFPLNPAGKVDRKALPEPDTARPELKNEFVAPRNEAEETFAEIWASVLSVDEVGIHDNYFDLGGASMQGLEIAALAAEEGYAMTPAMLFQYPTIAELAAAVPQAAPTDLAPPSGNGDSGILVAAPPKPEAKTKAAPLPKPATEKITDKINTIIESVGIYLPPNVVSTKELLKRCHKKMWFPLEKMTGIKNRRMCSPDELCKDIAIKAVEECLANSKYEADDMDMLISCNITRSDEYRKMSVEPNTSIQVKARFGFKNAICFDVCNACTGMFTAIKIVESFINAGAIRRAMVISGEYVTGISETALIEIAEFMDPRLACLTVGDAGAAVIVEGAANNNVGFHELDMYSLSKYCWMCVGRLTEHPHGGAIMHVPDPMEHTMVAVKNSVANAMYNFERSPWSPEDMDVLIMHQTSDRSLRDGMRAINKALGKKKICTKDNTINNLAERGNTATTTHFVALWDSIFNGKIKSGDNAVFGITGSGQTIGTGIYTFDDLPDRMRRYRETGERPKKLLAGVAEPPLPAPAGPRVRIHSIGTLPLDEVPERDTTKMTSQAAEACLAKSTYDRSDIELLIFGGMLRTGYISEPAIATLIGGELKMNDIIESEHDKKTFCFDIYNASMGLLHALEVAARMIQAGPYKTAMVCASEVEVNVDFFPDDWLGFCETASAAILDTAPDGASGFGQFVFKYHHEHADARKAIGGYKDGKPHLKLMVDPEIEGLYLKYIPAAVEELLHREGLDISQVAALMPPQFSTEFNMNLAQALGIATEKMVDLPHDRGDLFTSSPVYGIEAAQNRGVAKPGDVGLVINVGSGIQIGCATYYF